MLMVAYFGKGELVQVTTLDEYRKQCGWSMHMLARAAGMDINTVRNALDGKSISPKTAGKLADAISQRLAVRVRATDIEGLNVNW